VVSAGAATLVLGTLVSVWLVHHGAEDARPALGPGLACGFLGSTANVQPECAAAQADLMRRKPVPADQQAKAESASNAIRDAVFRMTAASCPPSGSSGCPATFMRHWPKQPDVDALRQLLDRLGYRDNVVRLGHPHDTVPEGAMVWAVKLGEACVYGTTSRIPAESIGQIVVGTLPDGTCLAQ
jgi:hypothetical protein